MDNMDNLVNIAKNLLVVLVSIDTKLDGIYNELGNIQGSGLFNSISDLYDKLEAVENELHEIESTIC